MRLRFLGLVVLLGMVALSLAQVQRRPGLQNRRPIESRAGGAFTQVPDIIRLMIRATRTLRYSGTRTVEFKRGADRESHVEFVVHDGPRSRVEFPEGSKQKGQIIIEDEKDRLHYLPDTNEIQVLPARKDEGLARLGMLLKAKRELKLNIADGERVAGLPTTLVSASDRQGNVVQKLWIHPATGLLLKRELFDPIGTRIGYFEFTQVNLSPNIRTEDFRINRKGARRVTPADILAKLCRNGGFDPVSLPSTEGYRLENSRLIRFGEQSVLSQVYQSESGPLSLFQTKAAVDPDRFAQIARRQRFQSYAWQMNGKHFALVGDVETAELHRLARLLGDR